MVSQDNLRETANRLLGNAAAGDMPWDRMAEILSNYEQSMSVSLSAYGYIMWAHDHYRAKCAYKNILSSVNVMNENASEAKRLMEHIPELLVNAHTYVTKIMSNVPDLEACFQHLEGMSFPYVLYVLFAGTGQKELVQRYKIETAELLKRYPSAFDKLPESFRLAGQEATYADIEQR